jgi:hypothetical protein
MKTLQKGVLPSSGRKIVRERERKYHNCLPVAGYDVCSAKTGSAFSAGL